MSSNNLIRLPVIDSQVTTACGSVEKFTSASPRAIYEGTWVFFCTPLCQEEFIQNPGLSCYADQMKNKAE
jgi:YHS domain-containing protein